MHGFPPKAWQKQLGFVPETGADSMRTFSALSSLLQKKFNMANHATQNPHIHADFGNFFPIISLGARFWFRRRFWMPAFVCRSTKTCKLTIISVLGLRSRRPGTGPQNGNSRKVLAGVLAQVLAKMGVLAGVLAHVLASCFVSVFPKGPTCASTPASTPIFASTCASTPASTFLEFPFWGPVPGRRDLNFRSF